MSEAEPQVEEEKQPNVVRQIVANCYSDVLDTMLGALPYSESMRLLARATEGLSNSQA